mmetsp:Transcript_21157/g.56390  ORF Transcript_21157/g.56390 Transcript_21157/m.56390 type:complete len:280 (-) Transcript_21157:1419-2258(-)
MMYSAMSTNITRWRLSDANMRRASFAARRFSLVVLLAGLLARKNSGIVMRTVRQPASNALWCNIFTLFTTAPAGAWLIRSFVPARMRTRSYLWPWCSRPGKRSAIFFVSSPVTPALVTTGAYPTSLRRCKRRSEYGQSANESPPMNPCVRLSPRHRIHDWSLTAKSDCHEGRRYPVAPVVAGADARRDADFCWCSLVFSRPSVCGFGELARGSGLDCCSVEVLRDSIQLRRKPGLFSVLPGSGGSPGAERPPNMGGVLALLAVPGPMPVGVDVPCWLAA